MHYVLAATALLERCQQKVRWPYARRNEEYPTDLPHVHWMLLQLKDTVMSEGKAGRWLGWVQACLVMKGIFTLSEMKALNRSCSCEDEGCPQFGTIHVHPPQKELSKEARQILKEVTDLEGIEVHKDDLEHPSWKEVLESGHVDQGPFRGPGRAWCRVVPKGRPIT